MPNYRVDFSIDIEADTPELAAESAWQELTEFNSPLPVATVVFDGDVQTVDLQALANARDDLLQQPRKSKL